MQIGPRTKNFSAATCGVSISSTMTRTRAHKTLRKLVFKPEAKKRSSPGSAQMIIFAPTKTRRGKTVYVEKDATPYYKKSKDKAEQGETSKRKPSKTPSCSRTAVPDSPEDTREESFQEEGSRLDDQEPDVRRITKVR
jgi:hypothetical protein